jgi:HD-like signal output (HDOD) protein
MAIEKTLSIKDLIEKELSSDDLELPFPDTMASMLNTMLGKETLSIPDLGNMVERDASLTAKILNLSNSAFYSGLEKTRTVDRAIARVGMLSIKGFLTASLLKEVFVSKGGFFGQFFLCNWRHSLGCAICAKRIAEESKLKSLCEDAYILGLVHDIGTIFILSILNRLKKSSKSHEDLTEDLVKEIIESFHPAVGARILEKLNFDLKYCRIVATHHDPGQFSEQEDPLFNILQVANSIMHKVGISINPNKDISIISIPSTAKLGLEPLFIAMLEIDIEEILATMDGLL